MALETVPTAIARPAMKVCTPPTLTVVIPAHDEARLIGATLQALGRALATLGRTAQVLVVDDASTDATAAIARQHGADVLHVQFRHIAATRNAGAAIADGDWLLFVDADTHVDARVLGAALAALQAGACGGGAAVLLQEPVRAYERAGARLFAWIFRATRIAPGCFVFCTRAAFEAVGGFDPTYFAAEDIAISRALARHGRFVILRQAVYTSPRKLRTHGLGEHLRLLVKLAWHRGRLLDSRQHLDLWYGRRRDGEP